SAWLPRTRGDRPQSRAFAHWSPPAPPHPRGSTRRVARSLTVRRGSPAPAGIDPGEGRHRRKDGRAPPHPRGSTQYGSFYVKHRDGSPAPAGIDPGKDLSMEEELRLPRTRGDRPFPTVATPVSR